MKPMSNKENTCLNYEVVCLFLSGRLRQVLMYHLLNKLNVWTKAALLDYKDF